MCVSGMKMLIIIVKALILCKILYKVFQPWF